MKFSHLTEHEREVVKSNNGLSSYLRKMYYVGKDYTPRSWFYENRSIESILKEAKNIIFTANKNSKFRELFNQIEEKNLEKFGPQGGVPALKDDFSVMDEFRKPSLYDDETILITKIAGKYGRDVFRKFAEYLFGKDNLLKKRRKSFDSVKDDMTDRDTLSSNSGWPLFTRRQKVWREAVSDAVSGKAYTYPAILLVRNYHGKNRPVWMYPMSLNLLEFTFSQVIQDTMRNSPNSKVREHLSPWMGYEDVKVTLTKTWAPGKFILGGDTTKMDDHMRRSQVRAVFEIVKWLFQKSEWADLYKIIMQICSIDLVYGPNQKLIGYHGLGSGSGWTQILETIIIMFIQWLKKILDGQGIGDDFEWLSDMTEDQLVQWLEWFGFPANPTKQSRSTIYLDFLQRRNVQGFYSRENNKVLGGYYSGIRALNSWLLPEKFHSPKDWSSDMYNARFFMIAENLVDDPCFEKIVAWGAKGQKDTIAFAKKTNSELDAIQRKSKLIPGLNPSYNQEKRKKPLSSFASIQLVRKMI